MTSITAVDETAGEAFSYGRHRHLHAGSGRKVEPCFEQAVEMSRFQDSEHLLRVVLAFALGTLVFVLARTFLVPRSFGEYGHYRANAIAEIAAKPVVFAGHQTCETCHVDIQELKTKGKHATVNCEGCHGALAKHAEDPGAIQPPKLDTAKLCVRCHEVNGARPQNFPQIVAKDHNSAELPCQTCHQPHSPRIGAGAKP